MDRRGRRRRPRSRAPSAVKPGGDPGDPVGLLVAQLAGAADRRRAAAPGSRPGRGRGSRRWPRRRRSAESRSPAASDERTIRSAIGSPDGRQSRRRAVAPARSSMSAPIARRRSMTARRVGLTPTPSQGQLRVGVDRAPATSQNAAAETSPGTRSIDRLHGRPSFDRPRRPPSVAIASLDRHAARPQHPLRVVARRDRLPDRRRARRPASPASRMADLTWADGTGGRDVRRRAAGCARPRSGEGGSRRVEPGAPRPSRRSGSMIRATGRRRNDASPSRIGGHRQAGEHARR